MPTLAVDFDGVIHMYSKGWHDGSIYDEPFPDAISSIHKLMRCYAVFIHTTRNVNQVAEWLNNNRLNAITEEDTDDVVFWNDQTKVLVSNRKLPAFAYIDDRAIRHISWNKTLDLIDRLEEG